jgi:hypothetical protein
MSSGIDMVTMPRTHAGYRFPAQIQDFPEL